MRPRALLQAEIRRGNYAAINQCVARWAENPKRSEAVSVERAVCTLPCALRLVSQVKHTAFAAGFAGRWKGRVAFPQSSDEGVAFPARLAFGIERSALRMNAPELGDAQTATLKGARLRTVLAVIADSPVDHELSAAVSACPVVGGPSISSAVGHRHSSALVATVPLRAVASDKLGVAVATTSRNSRLRHGLNLP